MTDIVEDGVTYKKPTGRPKGSKDKTPRIIPTRRGTIIDGEKTPLEYMLAVMNDVKADPLRRDKMAIAAAPFIHPKKSPDETEDGKKGKKQLVREKASIAGLGTEWGDDLQSEVSTSRYVPN